jgi:hypothetical protein
MRDLGACFAGILFSKLLQNVIAPHTPQTTSIILF